MKRLWPHGVVIAIIILLTFSPLFIAVTAAEIASAHGCPLDEGSVHPCVINGHDYGELLYSMGIAGWYALVSFPVGGLVLLVYLVVWAIVALIRRRAAYKTP